MNPMENIPSSGIPRLKWALDWCKYRAYESAANKILKEFGEEYLKILESKNDQRP